MQVSQEGAAFLKKLLELKVIFSHFQSKMLGFLLPKGYHFTYHLWSTLYANESKWFNTSILNRTVLLVIFSQPYKKLLSLWYAFLVEINKKENGEKPKGDGILLFQKGYILLFVIQCLLEMSIWLRPGLLWGNKDYQIAFSPYQPRQGSPGCVLSLWLTIERNLRSCKSWPDLSLGLNANKNTGWSYIIV